MHENKNSYFFADIPEWLTGLVRQDESPFDSLTRLSAFMDDIFSECRETNKQMIGNNVDIGEHVVLSENVIIGDNVTIMPHALIRPYSIICDGAVIGHAAEIKHSIIFPKAKVQSFCFAGDSIIGSSARVGSGTILANRGFNQEEICVKVGNELVSCGSDFCGAIIGDSARIGANSTTQPGTMIGPYSWIFPATNAWGFVPREKKVRNNKTLLIEEHAAFELSD